MFVEVQRADTKAAALFGVAGGLLAAAAAFVLSDNAQQAGWPLLVPLGVLSLSLMAAVVAALLALRPVLAWRCDQPPQGEGRLDNGRSTLRRVQSSNEEEQLLAEAQRLDMLRALARRKYRLIRLSVDLIVVAHGLAGSTLSVAPFTL
jgi:hypothetical protein